MHAIRRLPSAPQLETLAAGLLLLSAWAVFVGSAFALTPYLFVPTSVGYGALSRVRAIRDRRVLAFVTITLTIASAVLGLFMLIVALSQRTVINLD
jgi:hypothetical protein